MRLFYSDVFIARRFELLPELVSPEMVNHTAPPGHEHGFQPLTALVEALHGASPTRATRSTTWSPTAMSW